MQKLTIFDPDNTDKRTAKDTIDSYSWYSAAMAIKDAGLFEGQKWRENAGVVIGWE